jgi:membrane protease YdiL (CAAX protease family)
MIELGVDSGPTSRIPNLVHFLFFLLLTMFGLLLSEAAILTLAHGTPVDQVVKDQRLQLFAQALMYAIALTGAYFAMPVFWHRPFLVGLQWNWARVNPQLAWIGLAAGFVAQGLTIFIPHPKDLPVEAIFRNPALIWFLALFGVVIGPLFEEIMFRGFLLPAIAIAVDWVQIPRSPDPTVSLENLIAWRSSAGYSPVALVLSSLVTSALFALIHGPQLGFSAPAVALLMCVSLLLCAVRIRTGSVAASTIVHGCYNLSLFVTLFVGSGGFRHLDKM